MSRLCLFQLISLGVKRSVGTGFRCTCRCAAGFEVCKLPIDVSDRKFECVCPMLYVVAEQASM